MLQPNERIHIVGIGGTLRTDSTSRWALEHALRAAEKAGATTELLGLNNYQIPIFDPDKPLNAYGLDVIRFVDAARRADAMIWSTAGYHGTLAGVTKNALDFLEYLSHDERPYLHQRVIGLIATAGGELAAVNSINAMVHVAHALRGTVAPLFVAIPQASKVWNKDGNITVPKWSDRLDQLGHLVYETAERFSTAVPEFEDA